MFQIIALCLTAVSVLGATHHPKVYEDVVEYNKNENTRTARSSESTYKSVHQPPVFNFGTMKQQDHQKFRYTEQQKMNTMVNGMSKSYKYVNQPQNVQFKAVQGSMDDWQPFDPKMTKQNKNLPEVHHFKTTKDVKSYKPGALKGSLPSKSILKINAPQTEAGNGIINSSSLIGNKDLTAQSSDTAEEKIDLGSTENGYNKIIFVHPNQLEEQLKQNSGEKLSLENTDVNIKKPEAQLTVLNDLIGKNPNVQLEGLQRLLHNNPSKGYNFPVIQGPEPFQNKEQTTVTEKNVEISNIQVNPADNSISLQTPHLIGKDSLEKLQKQLDEAAKIQAQQVIARAQQEAQAQVEAQHKAIALAQVQAQKDALEKIQNSIYDSPQALPLIQNPPEGYQAISNTLGATQSHTPQSLASLLQAAMNHKIPVTSHNNILQKQEVEQHPTINALDTDVSVKNLVTQRGKKSQIINIAAGSKTPLYENVPAHSYGSKEILYYAPNHHHQAAAQLQAEKALLAQVEAQNSAILHSHKNAPSALRQILKNEQVASAETESASSIHSITEAKSEPTAYQQFIIESKEVENAEAEHKDYDDFDDVSNTKYKCLNNLYANALHPLLRKMRNCSKVNKGCRVNIKNINRRAIGRNHFIKKRNTYNVGNSDISNSTFFNEDNLVLNASRRYYIKTKPLRQNPFPKRHPQYHTINEKGNIPFHSFGINDGFNGKLPGKKENTPFNVLVINNNNHFAKPLSYHPKKSHGRKRRRKYRKTVVLY